MATVQRPPPRARPNTAPIKACERQREEAHAPSNEGPKCPTVRLWKYVGLNSGGDSHGATEKTLPTAAHQLRKDRHLGLKSRESPSPEDERGINVDRVGFWQHAAPGHQCYDECFYFQSLNGTSGR
eukprot:1152516-Pelagomonas_calceolata.AAC.1